MDYSQFNKPPSTDYSQFNAAPSDVPVAEAIPEADRPENDLLSLSNVIKTAVDFYTPRQSVAQGQETGGLFSEAAGKVVPGLLRAVGAKETAAEQYKMITGRDYLTPEQIDALPPEQGERVKKLQEGFFTGTLGGAWQAAKGLANLAGTTVATVAEPVVRAAQVGAAYASPLLDEKEAQAALSESLDRAETRVKELPANVKQMVKASVGSLGKTLADPGEQLATDPFAFLTDALTVAGVGASAKGALAAAQAGKPLIVAKNLASAASDVTGLPVYSYKNDFGPRIETPPNFLERGAAKVTELASPLLQSVVHAGAGATKGLSDVIPTIQAKLAAESLGPSPQAKVLETEVRTALNDKLNEAAKAAGVIDDATAEAKGFVKLPGRQFFGEDVYAKPQDAKLLRAVSKDFMLDPDRLVGGERILGELRNAFSTTHVVLNFPSWINASVSNMLTNATDAGVVGAFASLKDGVASHPAIRKVAEQMNIIDSDNLLTDAQLKTAQAAPSAAVGVAKITRETVANALGKGNKWLNETAPVQALSKAFGAIDNTSKMAMFSRYIKRAAEAAGEKDIEAFMAKNPEVIQGAAAQVRKFYPSYDLAGTGIRYLDKLGLLTFATYAARSAEAMLNAVKQNPALFATGYRRQEKGDEVALGKDLAVRVSGANPYVNPVEFATGGKGAGRLEVGGSLLPLLNTARGVDQFGRALNPNAPYLAPHTRSRALYDIAMPGLVGKITKAVEGAPVPGIGKPDTTLSLAQIVAPVIRPGDTTKYAPKQAKASLDQLRTWAKQEMLGVTTNAPDRAARLQEIRVRYAKLFAEAEREAQQVIKKQPAK